MPLKNSATSGSLPHGPRRPKGDQRNSRERLHHSFANPIKASIQLRYCSASARCCLPIASSPARSAACDLTFRSLGLARREQGPRRFNACSASAHLPRPTGIGPVVRSDSGAHSGSPDGSGCRHSALLTCSAAVQLSRSLGLPAQAERPCAWPGAVDTVQ